MTAFYAPLRGLSNAIDQIVMLDSQMVELRRVMDATPATYNKLMEESIALSSELGNRIEDVNNAMVEFARQGFDASTLMALTETATIAANISDGLSTEDAMSTITAGMKAFNIEAENSISIIDRLNEIDNNFAITTATLSEALNRSAATANTFGVTMDELLGQISAIGITTRESGSVIGNSLKSIYSRLTTMQPAINALESVGVAVRGMNGEMRSATDILNDLATRWDTLDAATQQNLATTVAGRYQLSRFLTLMQQWDTAIEVTNTSLQSQGSALREQAEYSESLEARLNRLSNAGVSLAETLGSAFLTDSIVVFAESITELANRYEKLISTVGFLPPILGLVGSAVIMLSRRFRDGVASMTIFQAASNGLTISLERLRNGLRLLAASTGVGLLFAAVGFAVEKTVNAIGKSIKETEELQKQTDELVRSYSTNRQEIEALAEEYQSLNVITSRTAEEEERYIEVSNRLGELVPSIIKDKDEEGNARLRNVEAIQKEIEALEELALIDAREFIDNFAKTEKEIKNRISSLRSEMDKLYLDETRSSGFGTMYERGTPTRPETLDTELTNPEDMRQELLLMRQQEAAQRELTEAYIEFANAIARRDGMTRQLSETEQEYIQTIIDVEGYTEEAQNRIEAYAGSLARLAPEVQNAFDPSLVEGFTNDQIDAINGFVKALKDQENGVNGAEAELQKYERALETLGVSVPAVKKAIDEYNESLDENAQSAEDAAEAHQELVNSYDNAVSNIKKLTSAMDELNEGHGLSADTVGFLLDRYPDLLQYLNDEEQLRIALQEQIKEEERVAKQAILAKLEHNEQFYQSVIRGNADMVEKLNSIYGIDLTKFKTLNQAKIAVDNATRREMVKGWETYVKGIMNSMQLITRSAMAFNIGGVLSGSIQMARNAIGLMRSTGTEMYWARSDFDNMFLGGVNLGGIGGSSSKSGSKSGSGRSKSGSSKSPEEVAWENAQKALQKYINTIEDYEYKINREQALRENMEEGSAEYAASIQREIKLIQQQQAEITKYRNKINQIIRQDKISADHKRELTKRLQQLDLQYIKLNNTIQDYVQTQRESLADESLDLLRTMYEKRIELLEAERDEELKILDERLSNYEKYIRGKIDALNREYEEEDFEQQRMEMLEEQSRLQHEIDILSLNNSESAQARRIALEEELASLKKELGDLQTQRDRTLRQQNLEDELAKVQKETEANKSAIDERYDAEIYTMQELLKNEEHFANLRQQIIDGNVKNIQNLLKRYVTEFKSYNQSMIEEMGLSWQELINIMNKYNDVQQQVKNSPVSGGGKSSGGSSKSSGSSSKSSSGSGGGSKGSIPLRRRSGGFATPSGGWNQNSVVDRLKSQGYYAEMADREKLFKHFGGSGTYRGTASQNTWLLGKLKANGLETGGYTGNNEGFKYLHKHETILNKHDSNNFREALKYTRDLFKYHIPKSSNLSPSFANHNQPMRPINVYFGDIHNATPQQAETFGQKFINYVQRNGG